MTTLKLHHGDCLNVLDLMEENSVDAVVTDPPYELSNDGKQSANRVFLEFAFPENSYVETTFSGQNELSTFINKVLGLSVVGSFPRPTPAVPVIPMTLNDDVSSGYKNVKDISEGPVVVSDGNAGQYIEPKESEHLGCFALKLGNIESALDFINSSGSGFFSGGIGIGFGIESSGFPSLLARFQPVPFCGDDIGSANNALSEFISAFRGTKDGPVFRFNMGRTSEEVFSADSARLFCAFLICSGSQFVRASTTTGCLPAMLETRRISVVDDLANRAFSFDLVVHPQGINAKGFMGKSWDGSKTAFDVSTWRRVMRVLKPGGHMVAFGAPKNYHRLACAIEDAGFEVRDSLMWVFGQGFPKSLDVSKAIDKAAGAEREIIERRSTKVGFDTEKQGGGGWSSGEVIISAPATDSAREWQGWGTALKPAWESIIVASKPLEFDGEITIIGSKIMELEQQLWSMLPANVAEQCFGLSRSGFDAVCASAPWSAEQRSNTLDALLAQMDTSQFVSALISSLSTVSLWKATLVGNSTQESMSIIETELKTIIDLRTLKFLLSKITPDIIILAQQIGLKSNAHALHAVRNFNAIVLKLSATLELSAVENAISQEVENCRGVADGPNATPIILARKPLSEKTVAANVLKWGCGALNIDATRIEGADAQEGRVQHGGGIKGAGTSYELPDYKAPMPAGRWPANLAHDGSDDVLEGFPHVKSGALKPYKEAHVNASSFQFDREKTYTSNANEGSAARFFYCAKASKHDRAGSKHPTVKPVALMQWLIRMVTPPGGIILDPFAGSGTTGQAAIEEGFNPVLIERENEYVQDIQNRMKDKCDVELIV